MILPNRKKSSKWPLAAATALAAIAFAVAWAFLFRENESDLSDDDFKEIEAFEEYERRKQGRSS